MHFAVSVGQDFQSFMKPLQNQKPMIHVLHPKFTDLIHSDEVKGANKTDWCKQTGLLEYR